jgi:hypothetical protein
MLAVCAALTFDLIVKKGYWFEPSPANALRWSAVIILVTAATLDLRRGGASLLMRGIRTYARLPVPAGAKALLAVAVIGNLGHAVLAEHIYPFHDVGMFRGVHENKPKPPVVRRLRYTAPDDQGRMQVVHIRRQANALTADRFFSNNEATFAAWYFYPEQPATFAWLAGRLRVQPSEIGLAIEEFDFSDRRVSILPYSGDPASVTDDIASWPPNRKYHPEGNPDP